MIDPSTGRRRRRWIGKCRTKAEAERVLTAALKDLDEGILSFPAKITVRGYLLGDGTPANPGWVASLRNRVRDTTWASYGANVSLHVISMIGGLRLQAVTPVHLNSLYGQLLQQGLSPRTVRYIHAILHKAFAEAVDAGLVHTNPATRAKPPRPEPPNIAVLNPEEVARLLQTARGTIWEGPLTVSAGTGLRRGELMGLHWADVDLERGRLRVVNSLVRGPDGPMLASPKTQRGRRPVALPPFAVTVLRNHRMRQTERRLGFGADWQDLDLVFDRGDGGPLDPDSFTHAFRKISRKAGIPRARLHDLRHAFATMLLGKGVHPAIASAILGHATPGFTMRTYQHVVEGMEVQAATAIEEVFLEAGDV